MATICMPYIPPHRRQTHRYIDCRRKSVSERGHAKTKSSSSSGKRESRFSDSIILTPKSALRHRWNRDEKSFSRSVEAELIDVGKGVGNIVTTGVQTHESSQIKSHRVRLNRNNLTHEEPVRSSTTTDIVDRQAPDDKVIQYPNVESFQDQYLDVSSQSPTTKNFSTLVVAQKSGSTQASIPVAAAPINRFEELDFANEWATLDRKRINILTRRSKLHEVRGMLRELQYEKSAAEDKLIQHIRSKELGVELSQQLDHGKSIVQLLADVQDARDRYGPFEFECNQLEDELYREEFELHKYEADFFSRWNTVPQNQPDGVEDVKDQQGPLPTTPDESSDDSFDFHPLVVEYLSRKGDLDILLEKLDDLEEDYEEVRAQDETRGSVGLTLGREEQKVMGDFSRAQGELLLKIKAMKAVVNELRDECFQMKLVDEDGDPTDWSNNEWKRIELNDEAQDEQRNDDDQSQTSEYARRSKLLPEEKAKPFPKELIFASNAVREGMPFAPAVRVNLWLFGVLQCSAIEVNNLARVSEGKGNKHGTEWELIVIQVWLADGTTITTAGRVYSSSMTTQAPQQPVETPVQELSAADKLIQYRISDRKYEPRSLQLRPSRGRKMSMNIDSWKHGFKSWNSK